MWLRALTRPRRSLNRRFLNLGIVLALGLTACDGSQEDDLASQNDPQSEAPLLQVSPIAVEKLTVQDMIIGTGTIAAKRTSNIGAAVEGIIDLIAVKVGDRVEEGDLLFQSRRINYEISVARTKSELDLVKAQAEEASREYKRVKQLFDRGNAAKARLDSATSTRNAADANVAITTANLQQAEQNLTDTIIRAPYTAVVTERYIDEGVYRTVQMMGADSTVIQIQEISTVTAIINVPESHLSRLILGGTAQLSIDGLSQSFDSTITTINDKIDLQTRSVEIRLVLPNPDYLIKPGLFVKAEIMPAPRTVLLVKRKAILENFKKKYVFVASKGRAERRSVKVVDYDADHVEIISGLTAGEEILAGPDLPLLVDGYLIREQQDVAS